MTLAPLAEAIRNSGNAWILMLMGFAAHGAHGAEAPLTNVVSGTVRVFDIDGRELNDRSDVVVFVDGIRSSDSHQSMPETPQISHKGRQFSPSVLPLVRGSSVDFINDDDIYHNVFSLSKPKTFDLGIYEKGASRLVTFPQAGVVKIHCNIHPKMISTILVLNNDLFAKTGPNGSFRIAGVPSGQITLRVWSEFSEPQSRVIDAGVGETVEASFEVHETKRYIQHRDKFGKRYREKY